jgi:hypothetical protein|tara:strand:+ start:1746 stop:2165 length:420 start_codon:yes stop_codon:yes gene_type:complete
MDVGKAIYNILSTHVNLTNLTSTRIFPMVARVETAFPFVIYDVTGQTPTNYKQGVSTLDTTSVMISCYSETYSEACEIADIIRTALDRRSGTYNGVVIQSIKYDGYNDFFDVDSYDNSATNGKGVFRKALDFDVRIVNA